MKFTGFFSSKDHRLKAFWRILLFLMAFGTWLAPLLLLNNALLQFIGAAVGLVLVLHLSARFWDQRNFREYGLQFNLQTGQFMLIGFLFGLLAVGILFYLGYVTGLIAVTLNPIPIDITLGATFLLKMFLVAFLEETFFRGYLLINLKEAFLTKRAVTKRALTIAMLVTSGLFGLAHWGNSHASLASLMLLSLNGLVWCIPVILTKNLGLSIGLHTAWNSAQTFLGFTMSGNAAFNSLFLVENLGSKAFTGGNYGPEAGLLGVVGYSFMLFATWFYLKWHFKK